MQMLRYTIAVVCFAATVAAAPPAEGRKEQRPSENQATAKAGALSKESLEKVRRAAGMIVYLDPVTGEMRAPTSQERAALLGQADVRSTAQAAPNRPVQLPGGGLAIQTDSSGFDFAVATQDAHGKIHYHCAKLGDGKVVATKKAEGGDTR